MAKQKKELSKALKTFYGVGDGGFLWVFNIENYYFNFFLTNVAQFSLPMVTMITTVTSTIDALTSWIYGAILNSLKPMKWGRYRSWLLITPWIVPFLYAFQFLKIGEGMLAAIIVMIGTLSSHIIWNLPYTASMTMVSVASSTPQDRVALSTSRSIWNNIFRVLYSYVGPFVVSVMGAWLGEKNAYAGTAFVFGMIMAVLMFVHFKLFDGYEETGLTMQTDDKSAAKDTGKTGAGDLVKSLFQNPPLLVFLLCETGRNIWNFAVLGMTMYYFTYIAHNMGLMSTYILVVNILAIVGVYVSRKLAAKISARNTYIVGLILMTVGCLSAYILFNNVILVMVMMAVSQFGYGCSSGLATAIYGDIIVYSEWKTGKNAAGWIMGLQNVPIKIGAVVRGLVISACLAAGNFVAGMDPASASTELVNAIRIGFMVFPGACALAACVLYKFGYKLTQEKVEMYTKEIAEKK